MTIEEIQAAEETGLKLCRWEEDGEVTWYWWRDREPPDVGEASDHYPDRQAALAALRNDEIEWM